MKFTRGFHREEHIVSMAEWKGKLFVATDKGLYEVQENKATRIKLTVN